MTLTKQLVKVLSNRSLNRSLLLGLLTIGAFLAAIVVEQFTRSTIYQMVSQIAFLLGETYERWFSQQQLTNPLTLVSLSFVGGLVASISPCILSLLPVNLSYIGTQEVTSRRDALLKASSFVLGVATILSLLGLVSSFASIVLIQFQGYVHVAVGIIIVLMGLSLAGILRLPLPQIPFSNHTLKPNPLGRQVRSLLIAPYGVGVTFALISSPCTSPVMIAVLSAAATAGSSFHSILAMVCYALGYTAVIFFASLFTGLVKQTRLLLKYTETVTRIATVALLLVGSFYLVNGGQWVFASLMR